MKVLLLNPVTRDGTRSLRVGRCQGKVLVGLWPNIEYGYLAALLGQAGFRVMLQDANAAGLSFATMLKRAVVAAPDIVLILSISATLPDDLEIGRRLAAALPNLRRIYWGTHATVRPEDYLEGPTTFVVRREPEHSALALCQALRDGCHDFDDMAGVSWHDGHGPRHGPGRPFLADLDTLPLPDHGAMRTGKHWAADTGRPFGLIKVSRGCPHRCVFCTVHAFHGNRWRSRSPASIVEEIRQVRDKTGVRDFFLQSDVFSQGRMWVVELCERLAQARLGVSWFCNSRVDTLDEPLLRLMKQAGCRLLAFGVESGADDVLTAIDKGTDSAHAAATLEACRRAGIVSLTYWVFGLPGETEQTISQTKAFIDRTRPDYAHFYSPTALPGSRLYERYEIGRRVATGEFAWQDFFQGVSTRFVAPTVTPAQVEDALRDAYWRFYSDPRRLSREFLTGLRDIRRLRGRATTFWWMVRNYAIKR